MVACRVRVEDTDNNTMDEENSESDGEKSDIESKTYGNPGLADVFQKILKTQKPKKKKTLVLSRAKKLSEVTPKEEVKPVLFEIEGETDEIKKEVKPSIDVDLSKKTERKHHHLSLRTKPSISDRGRERMLQKIATKGVVQLFNAVKQQQTDLDKKLIEAGPLERKREKVLKSIDKRAFLDVLMGGSKSIPVENATVQTKSENKSTEKTWEILRDDFVMGAKLKNWDKAVPDEEQSSEAEDMDSD